MKVEVLTLAVLTYLHVRYSHKQQQQQQQQQSSCSVVMVLVLKRVSLVGSAAHAFSCVVGCRVLGAQNSKKQPPEHWQGLDADGREGERFREGDVVLRLKGVKGVLIGKEECLLRFGY